jgi:hypothetical protein
VTRIEPFDESAALLSNTITGRLGKIRSLLRSHRIQGLPSRQKVNLRLPQSLETHLLPGHWRTRKGCLGLRAKPGIDASLSTQSFLVIDTLVQSFIVLRALSNEGLVACVNRIIRA